MKTILPALAILVFVFGASCKKEVVVKADVSCKLTNSGMSCTVTHQAGDTAANVCWTANMTCRNAAVLEAQACQVVQPLKSTTKDIHKSQFKNLDLCDAISGLKTPKIVATPAKK